jgi:hypothetical protein
VLAVYLGEQSNVAYIPHVIGFLTGVPFGAAWSKNLAKNLLITMLLFLIYLAIVIFLIPLLTQTIARPKQTPTQPQSAHAHPHELFNSQWQNGNLAYQKILTSLSSNLVSAWTR